MTFRVHRPASLTWRKIGDIPMGWMRDHIDATELEGELSFHEVGDAETPQLMEMRLNPGTLIAPHSHEPKTATIETVETSVPSTPIQSSRLIGSDEKAKMPSIM